MDENERPNILRLVWEKEVNVELMAKKTIVGYVPLCGSW